MKSYIFGKQVQMMNHTVRNRQHTWNLLDMNNLGMDFRIHNVRNQLHRMSLKCHTDTAMHCIALVAVDTVLHVMVHRIACNQMEKKEIY